MYLVISFIVYHIFGYFFILITLLLAMYFEKFFFKRFFEKNTSIQTKTNKEIRIKNKRKAFLCFITIVITLMCLFKSLGGFEILYRYPSLPLGSFFILFCCLPEITLLLILFPKGYLWEWKRILTFLFIAIFLIIAFCSLLAFF